MKYSQTQFYNKGSEEIEDQMRKINELKSLSKTLETKGLNID